MTIAANAIRYIKLGRGGKWEKASLDNGELHFGHGAVSHDLAMTGNRDEIIEHLVHTGRDPRAAAEDVRELLDFYQLGGDCLWVTLARDHLWWTFAEPDVTWIGFNEGRGERMRRSIGGWRNTDVNGMPLRIDRLSTKLTKVASYRRTLCSIEAEDYLLRRINGIIEPIVERSTLARDALLDVVAEAIKALHWPDFETLVDVMFARSGWHRASVIGGTQKLVDLVLEQPTTGERAAVQVKSAAGQKQLEEFITAADESASYDRLFFACHTPRGHMVSPAERRDIHIWAGRELAAATLRLGLADWVIEKVS